MDVEQALKSVRDIYVNYPKIYEQLQEELRKLDMETQDLLHYMELKNLDVQRGYIAYKELQEVRQKRRQVKDQIEILEPIMALNRMNKPPEKQINATLGEVRKINLRHGGRHYCMRVRKDLQEVVNVHA